MATVPFRAVATIARRTAARIRRITLDGHVLALPVQDIYAGGSPPVSRRSTPGGLPPGVDPRAGGRRARRTRSPAPALVGTGVQPVDHRDGEVSGARVLRLRHEPDAPGVSSPGPRPAHLEGVDRHATLRVPAKARATRTALPRPTATSRRPGSPPAHRRRTHPAGAEAGVGRRHTAPP